MRPTMRSNPTDALREAAAAGDWPALLRLWEAYAAALGEDIQHHHCTRLQMAEAGEFLKWVRRVVLCSRAQIQTRLDTLHAARLYGAQLEGPRSNLRTSL